jgi:hypothetical protein
MSFSCAPSTSSSTTATSTPSSPDSDLLDYDRLNNVVKSISTKLANPSLRKISNRAIQAKIWSDPQVSSYMTDLRHEEESIRKDIMLKMSSLIQDLHQHCIDTTLARASITKDERIHAGSSLVDDGGDNDNADGGDVDVDIICLDAKERLYLILKEYGWMKDFFRLYPMHFFENSFQFVNNIPKKKLDIKIKVVGLGVGGSLAVSGLKKRGIDYVIGYEKRSRYGGRSVTSRYQNASWRAYDIAQGLLDEEAYNQLVAYQQKINVSYDDGTEKVLTSDRVQIILGSAIDSALASAERYGAELQFDCKLDNFYHPDTNNAASEGEDNNDKVDIVALFTGAHTSNIFPGLSDQMNIFQWPELSSNCKMWLQIKPSEKRDPFTARDIEVGAENWHFAIESARKTIEDVKRIRDALTSQYLFKKSKMVGQVGDDAAVNAFDEEYQTQLQKINNLIVSIETAQKKDSQSRFDYIFANAPDNEYNRSKIAEAKSNGNVVIDGQYQVDIKIASKSAIDVDNTSCDKAKKLCEQFSSNVVVMGGDACVPPNPMAAYGATLACEFAEMLVQLAVSHGHLNSITTLLENVQGSGTSEWGLKMKELKALFTQYYDARGRAENYFQWMQTLICNLYSLPPRE